MTMLLSVATTVTGLVTPARPPLWSRSDGLALLNHPLLVQLGSGALPAGAFNRLLLDRQLLVSALRDGATAATAELIETHPIEASELLTKVQAEFDACDDEHAAWVAAATAAGRTIELPEGAEERCYNCGGRHLNVDCPEEAAVSSGAQALAAHLRSASAPATALAAAAPLLRSVGWAHATLRAAQLSGGGAYDGWVTAHAERWTVLAAASEACYALCAADEAGELAAASVTASLCYAWVDAEAGVAGLRGGAELQAAREAIDAVEPGFLSQQDRNAAFLREALGAEQTAGEGAAPAAPATKRAAQLEAAAAYLAKKRQAEAAKEGTTEGAAAGAAEDGGTAAPAAPAAPAATAATAAAQARRVQADAKAAMLAANKGPKQKAALAYLAVRKKEQAAAAYKAQQAARKQGTE